MKTKYLLGSIGLLLIAMFCVAFSFTTRDDLELAKQELVLRKIGHELLLQSGDRSSRVLPIKKIGNHQYQIRFEKELTFQPDSLTEVIGRLLSKDKNSQNYIVNVLNCAENAVVFGYAISRNAKDNIMACSGRIQPKACYVIDIKFENQGITPMQKGYLVGSLPLLAFVGLLFFKSGRFQKNKIIPVATTSFQLGESVFDPQKRQLISANATAELTLKENKLLLIFAHSPNLIIERARLQKEIWEDEGVIVGRSLDMFISKLRKKLENDSSLQLVNIHGKGYRLEIGGKVKS